MRARDRWACGDSVWASAEEGAAAWTMGSLFEMKFEPRDTGGALGLAVVHQPAGVATPLHRHTREAEVFHLLGGRIRYEAGGVEHELTAGSTMYLPMGVPHRFLVVDDARLLAIVAPGGLLDLYTEVGAPATERTSHPPRSRRDRSLEQRRTPLRT